MCSGLSRGFQREGVNNSIQSVLSKSERRKNKKRKITKLVIWQEEKEKARKGIKQKKIGTTVNKGGEKKQKSD